MSHSVEFQRDVITVRPHETIRHVVELMRDRGVDAVVVVNEKEEPVGIVTDRDVAFAVVMERYDPGTSVCFIMTSHEDEEIAASWNEFRHRTAFGHSLASYGPVGSFAPGGS